MKSRYRGGAIKKLTCLKSIMNSLETLRVKDDTWIEIDYEILEQRWENREEVDQQNPSTNEEQ